MSVQKLHLTENDRTIVLICTALLAVVLFFLLNDRWLAHLISRQVQTGEKIGYIHKGHNDVRRKEGTSFVWMPVSKSDDVYDADTVYTGQDSSTEIQLEGGGSIALDQQSLVVIKKGHVDLLEGTIWSELAVNQELKLNTPKGEILIHGSADKTKKVKVEMSPSGPKVYSTDPSIRVEQAGKKIQVIKSVTTLQPAVDEINPPELIFPHKDATITLEAQVPKGILFHWSSKDNSDSYEVQLSDSVDFKNLIWNQRVADLGALSKPLAVGDYFWRVRNSSDATTATSDRHWSQVGHFKIDSAEPPRAPSSIPEKLKAPKLKMKDQLFKHDSTTQLNQNPNTNLWRYFATFLFGEKAMAQLTNADELEWEEIPGAVTYDIEISKDPDFKKIYKKESLGQPKYIWEERKSGKFYWHVRGIGIDNLPGHFSETGSFVVQIDAPVKQVVKVAQVAKPSSPQQIQETSFRWNRIPFAEAYEIQFSPDESFEHSQKLKVEDTMLKVKISSVQKYWRVRALVAPEKYSGDFSSFQEIVWEGSSVSAVPGLKPVPLKKMDRAGKVPTYFNPQDNGVTGSAPGVAYALKNGTRLILGEAELDLGLIDLEMEKDNKGKALLKMSWPKEFFRAGGISVRTGNGKTELIKSSFLRKDLKLNSGKVAVEYVLTADKSALLTAANADVQFCIENTKASLISELCSARYRCDLKDKKCTPVATDSAPSVSVNGKPAALEGLAVVDEVQLTSLNIHDSRGSEVRIETKLKTQSVKDIVTQEDGILIVSGIGSVPLNPHVLEREQLNWRAAVFPAAAKVYYAGENGVPILMTFKPSKKLPQESTRAYIAARSPHAIYGDNFQLQGLFSTPGKKVSSTKNSAQNTGENNFTWDFSAPDKHDSNTSKLNVQEQGEQYVGSYELYRGNHYELHGILSDLVSSSGSMILGNVIFTDWFENVFKCDNPKLCFQHWGATASVFSSSTTTDQFGNSIYLRGYYADLRYRFSGGVNNHESSGGLLVRYENLTFAGTPVSYLGIGAFYNLTTPSLVNHVLDYFPWFRFPKVLDLELTYYPTTLSSGVTLGNSPNLEALIKGKMFLRPSFFIEGGIGFQQLMYTQAAQGSVQAYIFDLKGGVGWDF